MVCSMGASFRRSVTPVLLSIIVLYCFLLLAQVVSAGQGKWVIGIGGGLRPGRRGFRRFYIKKVRLTGL